MLVSAEGDWTLAHDGAWPVRLPPEAAGGGGLAGITAVGCAPERILRVVALRPPAGTSTDAGSP